MPQKRPRFALVTGCGQGGIGEALVQEYKRHGIQPIATVLPSEYSEHLVEAGIIFFPLDVTNEDSILALKQNIVKITGGSLDFLVNNAGLCYTMTAIDTDVAAVQKLFDVNLFGPMRMVRYFHDFLVNSKGAIVNIGSIGGIVPYVYGSSYNASKAALHHWSSTLRVEMAPFNVNVLTIISGEVGTNFLKTDQDRKIPDDSFFAPLALEFQEHVRRIPITTDRFDYANKVVSQSLRSDPPAWFWYGHASTLIRLLDALAPRRVWDFLLWGMFNFKKLRDAHQLRMTRQ